MTRYAFRVRAGLQTEIVTATGEKRYRSIVRLSYVLPAGELGEAPEGTEYVGEWTSNEAEAEAHAGSVAAFLRTRAEAHRLADPRIHIRDFAKERRERRHGKKYS